MPRLGIGDLPLPPRKFDLAYPPHMMSYGFETVEVCEHEDRIERSKRLARVDFDDPLLNREARRLAKKLANTNDVPCTRASRQWCRDERRATTGAIWQLTHEHHFARIATGTLTPEGWRRQPGELLTWNPEKALNALRSALNYYGAKDARRRGQIG